MPVRGGNSPDPIKRARSLANLQRGGGRPVSAENNIALKHGGRAAVSAREAEPKVREICELLGVDAPIRGEDGDLPSADRMAMFETATTLVQLDRVRRDLVDHGWKDQATG